MLDTTTYRGDASKITRYIVDALEQAGGTHALEDVHQMIRDGSAQLWLGRDSAIITEIINYPRFRALSYWIVAGDLAECLSMQDRIDAFARSEGCQRVLAGGREGWRRVLGQGWRAVGTLYARDL